MSLAWGVSFHSSQRRKKRSLPPFLSPTVSILLCQLEAPYWATKRLFILHSVLITLNPSANKNVRYDPELWELWVSSSKIAKTKGQTVKYEWAGGWISVVVLQNLPYIPTMHAILKQNDLQMILHYALISKSFMGILEMLNLSLSGSFHVISCRVRSLSLSVSITSSLKCLSISNVSLPLLA